MLDADYEGRWQRLTDAGYQITTVGLAQATKIGPVVLLVAQCLADGGRLLIVARPDEDAHLLERVHRLLAQRGETDNTKLHLMLEMIISIEGTITYLASRSLSVVSCEGCAARRVWRAGRTRRAVRIRDWCLL